MSVRLLGRAFYADLPAHLKLTLLALCDEASEDGSGICIGQKRLAVKIGATDRTVRSNLAALEQRGWLRKLDGKDEKYHTDRWEVVVELLPHGPEISSGRGADDQADRAEADDGDERKSGVESSGSGLPPTLVPPNTLTRKTSSSDPRALHLCAVLHDLLVANGVKHNVTATWEKQADLMLRVDGRDPVEAEIVLRWSQADSFWHSNILSMPKFRAQYDQLRLKMASNGNGAMTGGARTLAVSQQMREREHRELAE